jgi:predicted Ser/Thr protein kinase
VATDDTREHDDVALDRTAVATRTSGTGTATARERFAPGSLIGRYEISGELGRGGMGVVLHARDHDLERDVAVKLLHVGGADQRLLREAKAAAQLTDDNVINVYEVGIADDDLFIAMEYVDGGTLADWLESEQRSHEDIIDMFVRAGRGLLAAHERGYVHRDFKPQNVLIGSDGRVRVTDFGLVTDAGASSQESDVDNAGSTDSARLTHTGAIMGTPRYMAPEQHVGSPADARTDQFALCVGLYEALYGGSPFRGDTPDALATATAEGLIESPPRDSRVEPRVRNAVLRGLSPDPDDRFPSMSALLTALSAPRAARRGRWIGLGLVVAVIIVVVAVFVGREMAERAPGAQEPSLDAAPVRPDASLEQQRAREQYALGVERYKVGEYPAAIEHFQRAYEYMPNDLVYLDIAQAHWRNGDCIQALAAYQRIAAGDSSMATSREVQNNITALTKQCGSADAAP